LTDPGKTCHPISPFTCGNAPHEKGEQP
jgi:hypothetical protein